MADGPDGTLRIGSPLGDYALLDTALRITLQLIHMQRINLALFQQVALDDVPDDALAPDQKQRLAACQAIFEDHITSMERDTLENLEERLEFLEMAASDFRQLRIWTLVSQIGGSSHDSPMDQS